MIPFLETDIQNIPTWSFYMVAAPKGVELIAAKWADARKVTQVAFKPDWIKHAKAAPFKRDDAMLDVLPVGVLVFPGNGIQENLADKARKLVFPVLKFEKGA